MKKFFTILIMLSILCGYVVNANAIELVRQKNVATYITFPLIASSDDVTYKTAAGTPDSEIDQWSDGGAPNGFADCTNEATEIGTTGVYSLSLAQSEMNSDYIIIQIKATDANTQAILIRTIVGDPLLLATTDDGGVINVTTGAIDTVTTTATATAVTTVNGLAANVITATAINADAITADKIAAAAITASEAPNLDAAISSRSTLVAADNIGINWADISNPTSTVNLSGTSISTSQAIASVSGAVGSVTGAVGSVTGNVGGNVTGTIGGLTAGALADFFDTNSATTYGSAVAGSVVKEIADNAGGSALTAGGIADAVWDEVLSGHLTSGTCGYALNAAGAAGDPWTTALPGSYGAGTAGYIIGTNLNATISSRGTSTLTAANVWDANLSAYSGAGYAGTYVKGIFDKLPENYLMGSSVQTAKDDEIDAILVDTGTTLDDFLDTEIAAILADTAAMDTSTELRTLLTGADTAVSTLTTASAVGSVTGAVGSIATGGITSGSFAAGAITAASIATDAIGAAELAADAASEIGTAVWATTTRLLSAGTNIVLAKGVGITGLNDIAAADVWSVVTRSLTILDEDSTTIDLNASTVGGLTTWDKTGYTVSTVSDKTGYALSAGGIDSIWDEAQSGHTTAGTFGKYLDNEVSEAGSAPTTGEIADAVLDELLAGHTIAGSLGKKIDDLPTAGVGDWTVNEKAAIKATLGVEDDTAVPVTPESGILKSLWDRIKKIRI